MATAALVDPLALRRRADALTDAGDVPQARRLYTRLAELADATVDDRVHAWFELAALEDDLDAKSALLDRVLELEPGHRMAAVLRECLTPEMKRRVERSPDVLLPIFSRGYNLQLQTSSFCNATCVMCPYPGSYHDTHPNIMSARTFDHALALLEAFPFRKVCLYLNNEPFLDKHLVEKIARLTSRLSFGCLEISTNGSALTERTVHGLVQALEGIPHEIWYSWHGVTKDVYERVMGLSWDQNIARLGTYLRVSQGRLKTVFRTMTGGRLHLAQQYSTADEARAFFERQIVEAGLDPSNPNLTALPFTFHDRAGSVTFYGTQAPEMATMVGSLKPDCSRLYEWLHIVDDATVILCCMDFAKETATVNIHDFETLEDLLMSPPVATLRNQALGRAASPGNFICRRCTSPGG